METAPCPRRSPRRSDTGRSRQTVALSATSPYGHALADLARPALGLSRAWPDRIADNSGCRAISGSALAPPTSAGRGCRGAGHRRRIPSSVGRDRCHLLVPCLRYRTPGGVSLFCGVRGCLGFLLRAIAFNFYRPHEPSSGPLLFCRCCKPSGARASRKPHWVVVVGRVQSVARAILAGDSVVNVTRAYNRASTQGQKRK